MVENMTVNAAADVASIDRLNAAFATKSGEVENLRAERDELSAEMNDFDERLTRSVREVEKLRAELADAKRLFELHRISVAASASAASDDEERNACEECDGTGLLCKWCTRNYRYCECSGSPTMPCTECSGEGAKPLPSQRLRKAGE